MRAKSRLPGWLALVAVLAAGCGRGSEARSDADAGRDPADVTRPAPGFALQTLDGDSLSLADLSDRKAILMNFWASWCVPCREEVPALIELHQEYSNYDFMVLGATVDDLPRDSRAFVEEMGMPYPSVITTPRMREEWELAPWLPTTLLVVDGRIVEEWIGPQTREEFEYPIRVSLGLAPPLHEVIGSTTEEPRG